MSFGRQQVRRDLVDTHELDAVYAAEHEDHAREPDISGHARHLAGKTESLGDALTLRVGDVNAARHHQMRGLVRLDRRDQLGGLGERQMRGPIEVAAVDDVDHLQGVATLPHRRCNQRGKQA